MKRGLFVAATLVTALGLLVGACAPAVAPASPTATPAPTKPAPAPTPNQTPAPTVAAERPRPTVAPAQQATPTSPPKAPLAAESPKYGGVLNLVLREDPPHLDMHLDSIGSMLMALSPNYSLLVQFDPKEPEKVIPDLAERWEISSDGKVYTFYLRKGAKFHDGSPVTAKDVTFTFNNIVFPPKGVRSKHQAFFTALEKVEAVDDYTVRMTTKFPQASFISMVAIPFAFIYSQPYYQAKGDMRKDVMGSGPFKLKNYSRGVSFEVEKNPAYFLKDRPYLDGITFYLVKDYAAIASALKTRRLDAIISYNHNMSRTEREALKKQYPEIVTQDAPSATARALNLNLKRKPWSDARVRQAISLALDRDAFAKIVARDDGQIGTYLPPGSFAIPPDDLLKRPGYRKPKDQDIAEAKKLLAEAGYERLKFTIVTRVLADYSSGAVVVKDQLKALGMDVDVKVMEDGAYYEGQYAFDFDASIVGGAVPLLEPDQILPANYMTGSETNWSGYSNPKVDELILKEMQTMDPVERKKLIREIEEVLMKERPRENFYWRTYSSLWWQWLKNYQFYGHYLGHKMQDVWLDR